MIIFSRLGTGWSTLLSNNEKQVAVGSLSQNSTRTRDKIFNCFYFFRQYSTSVGFTNGNLLNMRHIIRVFSPKSAETRILGGSCLLAEMC